MYVFSLYQSKYQSKNSYLFVISLFFLVFSFSSSQVKAQVQEKFITLAAKDYQAYQESKFKDPRWDPYVQEGFEAFDREDLQTAVEFLRKAYLKGCRSPIVLFKLALSFESMGSYYSAVQYFELAGPLFKKSHKGHRYRKHYEENYGRALYMLGSEEKAIEVLKKAATKSDSAWILRLLGKVSIERKDYLEAVAYYERLLKLENSDVGLQERVDINRLLARIFRNQDQKQAAERYYKRILEVHASDPEAVNYLHKFEPKPIKDNKIIEELLKNIEN